MNFDVNAEAVKIANLSPALTKEVFPSTECRGLGAGIAAGRLSRWLDASRSLPAARRAAALLVEDSFVACVAGGENELNALAALGAKFVQDCPQNGLMYANNFREQAESLDPAGPTGALAALASLQSQCSLKGPAPWADRVLDRGQKILAQFPAGPWSAWVHFAMARAHAAKLSFSLPPGEVDRGVIHPLSPAEAKHERSAAIAEFAQFIREQPNSQAAAFAWQEAWRLMAGLPPSPLHFGCGCE